MQRRLRESERERECGGESGRERDRERVVERERDNYRNPREREKNWTKVRRVCGLKRGECVCVKERSTS